LILSLFQSAAVNVPQCRRLIDAMVVGRPIDRRCMIFGSVVASLATSPTLALAVADVTDYAIDGFTVGIPSSWKVITKPPSKKGTASKLFSAIDLQSGSVITVVREQACSIQEYAQSQQTCDVVLPQGKVLFSEETLAKDISKLLIRHDDRDNAVLQGTTKLDSYQLDLNRNVVDLIATTSLPSGGTYRDTMGIDRPNTIDRRVKAKAVVEEGQGGCGIFTLWMNAPLDEWQKPVMGIKLNQIWDSVKYVDKSGV